MTQQSEKLPDGTARRPFAIVTGAARGLGCELALSCARQRFDLLVAADDPRIFDVATRFSAEGVAVEPMQVALETIEDVDELYALAQDRPVDMLIATVGREPGFGAGEPFLAREFDTIRRDIDTNVAGTLGLVHRVGRAMRTRGQGRILIVSSLLEPFAASLRMELRGVGVTVTSCPPPIQEPHDAAAVARACVEAMLRGDAALDAGAAKASSPAARVRTAS